MGQIRGCHCFADYGGYREVRGEAMGRLVLFAPFGLVGFGVSLGPAIVVTAAVVGGVAGASYLAGRKRARSSR